MTEKTQAELNARFIQGAITILGRSDNGAWHRAIEIARRLVAYGLWDGESRIEFDAYALHDRMFGVAQVSPLDLTEGKDYRFPIAANPPSSARSGRTRPAAARRRSTARRATKSPGPARTARGWRASTSRRASASPSAASTTG